MDQEKELNLYQQVKANNRKALEVLFAEYYATLCNFAILIVKKHELAEEVVADAFFVLWRDRHQLDIKHSVKAYLFRIVRNNALRVVKDKRETYNVVEPQDTYMVIHNTPESDYLYDELSSTYQKAYHSLPTKCKQVFKLHKIDGLKYQEISEVMNISIKTVENQMLKALKIIRKAVVNYQIEQP